MSGSTALVQIETARQALAAAYSIPEVLDIRDKAEGVRAWAAIAGDRTLETEAADLRIRAERTCGLKMAELREAGELSRGAIGVRPEDGDVGQTSTRVTRLEDLDIGKHLADVARRYAKIPEDEFEAELARRRERIARGRGRITVTLFDHADKVERRAAREAALAEKIAKGHLAWPTLAPGQRVGVILDDPAWKDEEVWSIETGLDRAADNHYPTSSVDEIAAHTIEMIRAVAAPDCALFRWTTNEHLAHAIDSVRVEGFTYRTNFAWDTGRLGMGRWNRSRHQILLLAVRGAVPCPAPGQNWDSLFDGPPREPGRHSSKPEHAAEMIEAYFPNLPKLEANRRGPARAGWLAWGDEAEAPVAPEVPKAPTIATKPVVATRAPVRPKTLRLAVALFDDESVLQTSGRTDDGTICVCVTTGLFVRRGREVKLNPTPTLILVHLLQAADWCDLTAIADACNLFPESVQTGIASIRRLAGAKLDLVLDNTHGRGWRLNDATPRRQAA